MRKIYLSIIVLFLAFLIPLNVNAETCNHQWGEWHIGEEATCGYSGYKYRYCDLCDEREEIDIPATNNHEWGNWEIYEQPSCYSNGERKRYCLECSEVQKEKISAYNSHQWGNWIITEKATCGYTGERKRYCLRCGDYKTETTPINPNNHVLGEWSYDNPTALYNGEKYRICDCGQVEERITIPKLKAIAKLNKTSLKLKKNKTYKLKLKKITEGDYVRYWKSSNKKIVTVDKKGKIKAKKKGKATITVKMESGVKATCKVTVK